MSHEKNKCEDRGFEIVLVLLSDFTHLIGQLADFSLEMDHSGK